LYPGEIRSSQFTFLDMDEFTMNCIAKKSASEERGIGVQTNVTVVRVDPNFQSPLLSNIG